MVEKHPLADPLTDAELDGLFGAARDASPLPSQDLVARILTDADAVSAPAPVAATLPPDRTGLFAGLLAALGGWPSVAGLASAAIAGVVIGVATPETLHSWTGGVLDFGEAGGEMGAFMPSLGDILDEG